MYSQGFSFSDGSSDANGFFFFSLYHPLPIIKVPPYTISILEEDRRLCVHSVCFVYLVIRGKSQNYRTVWVGTFKGHPVQPTCSEQQLLPPNQAAQSPIQPDLECSQGRGIHSSLGNLLQCSTKLTVKNYFLVSRLSIGISSTPSSDYPYSQTIPIPSLVYL